MSPGARNGGAIPGARSIGRRTFYLVAPLPPTRTGRLPDFPFRSSTRAIHFEFETHSIGARIPNWIVFPSDPLTFGALGLSFVSPFGRNRRFLSPARRTHIRLSRPRRRVTPRRARSAAAADGPRATAGRRRKSAAEALHRFHQLRPSSPERLPSRPLPLTRWKTRRSSGLALTAA